MWIRSFETIEELRLALLEFKRNVQRALDAGEVRLPKPGPGATRPPWAGRGGVEANTVKPLSKNPEAVQSTPAGGRATRRAHETHPGSLQLLWREWQRSQFGAAGQRHGAALVHVASPSKQPHASHLAEVRCVVGTIPSARASDSRANLGRIAMSHISGRAGWWKPPSPVLVRASGEQSSGATRQSKRHAHGPNHPCLIDRWRKKLGGPWRSSHSACCTRAALRPLAHPVSGLEGHRR